jgi:fermentation-respiration switch protein FrsA (DUF1100 family)
MLHVLHLLILVAYLVVPAVVLGRAMYVATRKGRRAPLRRFWVVAFGGLMSSVAVCGVYALAMHGHVVITQMLVTGYFATALLLILRGFDRALWWGSSRVMRLHHKPTKSWWFGVRAASAMVIRAVLLFGVGIPYVLATVMTYRPRTAVDANPHSLYGWDYETVSFQATDGTRLAAWWIPGASGETGRTVLLCHGHSANKATQLSLARRLVPIGYNVLAIDFRAHGESAGQLTSFGDLERRDVLGAVRWLRANHPYACQKVLGLGASTGAAALLAAAADPGPEGQTIDAIAVYGTFDRFDAVVNDVCRDYVHPAPIAWLVQHIGLPLAGAQVGTDLRAFSPADAVRSLWPRPILVIHGLGDDLVRFERGESLFDAAFQPKYEFWMERTDHEDAIKSDNAARLVRRFFDGAARVL